MPILTADDGAHLHFISQGSGPLTVIFLHCIGGSTAAWQGLWREMNTAGLQCVALDFRGTGKSEREPCELTYERLARDILFVADHLQASSFVVAGHSMGAKVGLFLAAMEPRRVCALVLLGCPSPGIIPIERSVMENYLADPDRRSHIEQFFRPWHKVWPRPELDAFFDSFAHMPEWALRACCELSMWTDISKEMASIICPILNLVGEHDPVYGPRYQREEVLPYVPSAGITSVDCGHGMMLEAPEAVAAPLEAFLTRLR